MRLHSHNYHRVAKNTLKFASIWALIFQALHTRHSHGKKVMFCARGTTVHFPAVAPGTPTRPLVAAILSPERVTKPGTEEAVMGPYHPHRTKQRQRTVPAVQLRGSKE